MSTEKDRQRARELTHTNGVMNPAPWWAHRLLDLAFGGWQIVPTGGLKIVQHAVPGEVYSAYGEFSKESVTVDFRDNHENGVWTVSVEQPQPEPVPPTVMPVEEWLNWKKGKK